MGIATAAQRSQVLIRGAHQLWTIAGYARCAAANKLRACAGCQARTPLVGPHARHCLNLTRRMRGATYVSAVASATNRSEAVADYLTGMPALAKVVKGGDTAAKLLERFQDYEVCKNLHHKHARLADPTSIGV